MSATAKLQEVQAELVERGVKDVKFFFVFSPLKATSEVANDAAKLLSSYLKGKYKVVKAYGKQP